MKKIIGTVAILGAFAVGGVLYANHVASEKVDVLLKDYIAKNKILESSKHGTLKLNINYDTVSANVITNRIVVDNIDVSIRKTFNNSPKVDAFDLFLVKQLIFTPEDFDAPAESFSLDIEDYQFSKETNSRLFADFPTLKNAVYSIHFRSDYDAKTDNGTLNFYDEVLTKNVLQVNEHYSVGNLAPVIDAINNLPEEGGEERVDRVMKMLAKGVGQNITLNSYSLDIKNEGELATLIDEYTATIFNGTTRDDLLEQMQELKPAAKEMELDFILNELIEFISDLGHFSLSISPEPPLSIKQLSSVGFIGQLSLAPKQTLDDLNFKIDGK